MIEEQHFWMPPDFDWKSPDYTPVFAERSRRLDNLKGDAAAIEGLKKYYSTRPAQFIHDWGMTADPRNAERDLPVVVPFLLFERQRELVNQIIEWWRSREDGLVDKSRDMGASWLTVAIGVWLWLFHDDVVIGYGSRKEEYVDKQGDPKSLFWKGRKFIELLPPMFRPNGFVERKHAPFMRIINPHNRSVIVGEAGDNIGRGNRTSLYFKDESAFLVRPESIEAALSQTSNCKIDVSSANGTGNPFYRKRFNGQHPVFTFHWHDDPRKDMAWYREQQRKLDPIIIAQEIDIDYSASVNDVWIEGTLVSAAEQVGPADVEVRGPWMVSIDAAHYGDDESVVSYRRGRLTLPQDAWTKLSGTELAGRVEDKIRTLIGGYDPAPLGAIVIELDGPGVSCYDQLKDGEFGEYVVGVHTGARKNDDRNYNLRALMWRRGKEYLENAPVSMPNDPELRSQISSIGYKYKDSLLLMQSKKEYKAKFGKSPDRADSWILGFAVSDSDLNPRKKQEYRARRKMMRRGSSMAS